MVFLQQSFSKMQIFVNCAGSRLVDVTADTTVEDVYTMVAEREGLCPSQVYLVNQGRVLESGTLLENGVNHLSIVNASVRLAGGKVHGSLARAGKVKGQTPKVEKSTDKKKKTTGKRL